MIMIGFINPMKSFSYTKSQALTRELEKVEELRKKLHFTPLSSWEKQNHRWDTLLDSLFYSLALADKKTDRAEIILILNPKGVSSLTKSQQEILRFRKTLDSLYHQWMARNQTLTADMLLDLYHSIYKVNINIDKEALESNLRYIQANPDNPLLQSALAQITILGNELFGRESGQMAHLISLIFLYNHGYDFRRMLGIDEYYYQHKDRFSKLITQSLRDPNVTPFLEFVVEATEAQLIKLLAKITAKNLITTDQSSILLLTNRQQDILGAVHAPGSKISNKDLQRIFKISPITAARDLAKLTSLGFLFSIGKGRSTYYTKV